MGNMSSFNWNIQMGDYIHYEMDDVLNQIKHEKKEKLLKNFSNISLVSVSLFFMLMALQLAAKV